METVCDLQRTGTLEMQGFKRSTGPNLQSLREWLQHVATHPSLIKLPWVPAAEGLWQQRLQPLGTLGDFSGAGPTPNLCWWGSTDLGTPGRSTWWGLHVLQCGEEIRLPAAPSHTTVGTLGDNGGPASAPRVCHNSLQTEEQPSASENHKPGSSKSHWL